MPIRDIFFLDDETGHVSQCQPDRWQGINTNTTKVPKFPHKVLDRDL